MQQTALIYVSIDPNGCALLRGFARSVTYSYGSVERRLRAVLFQFCYGYHASEFQCWWKVLPVEEYI